VDPKAGSPVNLSRLPAGLLSAKEDPPSAELTPAAKAFAAGLTGFPAVSGSWTAVRSGSCEDCSDMIPSFGEETRREFLSSFQPFMRPTLRKVEQGTCRELPHREVSQFLFACVSGVSPSGQRFTHKPMVDGTIPSVFSLSIGCHF
jgi:hypothetical protein